jgi:hypothetical protein
MCQLEKAGLDNFRRRGGWRRAIVSGLFEVFGIALMLVGKFFLLCENGFPFKQPQTSQAAS